MEPRLRNAGRGETTKEGGYVVRECKATAEEEL